MLATKKKKNEMSYGMLGEPSMLNPIQTANDASSKVEGAIFNGVLKYTADLEITGDLAKSYTLNQTTTFFFKDNATAITALGLIEAQKAQWAGWKLESATVSDNALLLWLSEPGMATSTEISALFDPDTILPVHVVRVDLEGKAREALEKFRTGQNNILREWFESDNSFELTIAGDSVEFTKALKIFFAGLPDAKAKIQSEPAGQFLAEPEVTFHLRDDVRWHDGEPFTSRDVAFTYKSLMDDAFASPRKADFTYILKVETPDAQTARVVYRKPYSPALSSWMIGILPAHILDGKTAQWWGEYFNRNPVGTGAFKFGEWKTNEYVRVVKNPDYFDAPGPWLDAIVFRVLPDQLALRLAFETRQVDFWGVDPWAVSNFEKDQRFELFSSPSNSYSYIGWNLKRPVFQDERVRRALAHGVNVPEMVKYILYGYGVQSTGIFTPQMWFYNPNVVPYTYDIEIAKKLLDEAGWKVGPDGIRQKDGQRFTFTLLTNNGNEVRRDIATLVQNNLRSLGIEAKIEIYEWAVFLKNFINKGNFDAMVLGWALGFDYDQFQIWHSSQNNPEQLNVVSYNNPEVDKLLANLRQEYNREKIIAMAGEMQSIIYRDQPYLFLYVPQSTFVVWKDSYRIRRPDGKGGWIESPIQMTKGGWNYYMDWFYRPEYADQLPK